MSTSTVTFYLPKLTDPAQFDHIDPETDWRPFRNSRGQAIPHTYIRLRQAGHAVQLSNYPPRNGIVVVFAGDMRQFQAERSRKNRPTVVCVQADRLAPEVSFADVIVQHNGLREDGRRRFFIPNWPQPGLVPRAPDRGADVTTVTYKGNTDNLRPEFLTKKWERFLAERGLTFVVDAPLESDDPRLAGLGAGIRIGSNSKWHDYAETDVVLAVRPPSLDRYRHKPAVKLINAWRAGTPALLGPEPAYRELRRSPLDYLEISSPKDAAEAMSRLCDDPSLYEAMVANGLERATEFSVESITARWETLLFETLSDWRPKRLPRATAPVTVPVRRILRGVRRRLPGLSIDAAGPDQGSRRPDGVLQDPRTRARTWSARRSDIAMMVRVGLA